MDLSDFDYKLPEELIAQFPAYPRGSSRLLHVKNHQYEDLNFDEITKLLRKGDTLVLNDTKVIPALLTCKRKNANSEEEISLTLVKHICKTQWQVLAKPAKKIELGKKLEFDNGNGEIVEAEVVEKNKDDNYTVIEFKISEKSLFDMLINIGEMPLPPYIKRKIRRKEDRSDYQTEYADQYGAFAAPTAGLHFSKDILEKIQNTGVKLAFVTLHVGLGTFLPVRVNDISKHVMHFEKFSLSKETCDLINDTKKNNRRVISVGTTSMRVLESCAKDGILYPQIGETNLFIKPGYNFKIVDALITNFHLTKSTLLMLVCAFSGRKNVMKAYEHAIKNKYRFFSYGDSSFLEKEVI